MLKEIQARIEEIENQGNEQMEILAEKVRQEMIIPVCLKHGIRFLSGNGTFAFFRGKSVYSMTAHSAGFNSNGMSPALRESLEPLYEILNTFYQRCWPLGFYVRDVIPSEVRREMREKANKIGVVPAGSVERPKLAYPNCCRFHEAGNPRAKHCDFLYPAFENVER